MLKFKAYNDLWYYFFDNHGLALIEEHIPGILEAVNNYNSTINAKNKTNNTEQNY